MGKMTKNQFLKFIENYHKKPGEYTEEELYEIGRKHKELDRADRNWNELAELLGVLNHNGEPQTGETFRCWIKAKQSDDGSLPVNNKLITDRSINELDLDEIQESLTQQREDLYKQQVRTRDEVRSYRLLMRNDARLDQIEDIIRESVSEMKKLTPVVNFKKENYVDTKKEAVLLFSDLHIGTKVNSFYNVYNTEIAKKRVSRLVNDTISYCKLHHISRLNVLNLGDMIAGLIHVNGRIEQEVDVIQQITMAAEIIAEALNKLQEAAPEIIYRSCTDNHSRLSADMKQHLESENLGKLIDFYLEARLKDTKVIFKKDNLDDDIGMFKLMNGDNFVFVHGHRDNYNTSFQSIVGATQQYIKYIAMGHWHSSKLKSFQGAKIFINGSIVGSDSYAHSKRLYGPAEQTLLIFDHKNLIVNYINVDIKK